MAAQSVKQQPQTALSEHFTRKSDIKRIVRSLETLPGHPAIVIRLLDMLLREDPDMQEISQMVETDQALAIEVLGLAGSSGKTADCRPASVWQALKIIGRKGLCSIILDHIQSRPPIGELGSKRSEDLTALTQHALACAACSKDLAARILPDFSSQAFTAGLLHDIGKLFFKEYFFDSCKSLGALHGQGQKSIMEAEQEILGIDHPTLGKWLAEKWRLPEILVNTIWMHHYSPLALRALPTGSPELKRFISIVGLADLLAHEIFEDSRSDFQNEGARSEAAGQIGLNPEEIEDVKDYARNCLSERSRFFELSEGEVFRHFGSLQNVCLRHIMSGEKADCDLINLYGIQREIAAVEDEDNLLDSIGRRLNARPAIKKWALYTLDKRKGRLNGRYGAPEKNVESFRAGPGEAYCNPPADLPFFEKDLGKLIQSGYSRFLEQAPRSRLLENEAKTAGTHFLIPLSAVKDFLGEVMVEVKGKDEGYFSETGFVREEAFCRFLAAISAATLSGIRHKEKLSEDSEGLSMALSKAAKLMELQSAERAGSWELIPAEREEDIEWEHLLTEQKSEREELSQKLDLAQQQLAVVLSHIPHGVIVTDTDGNITSLNKHSEILTGWSESEALGKPCQEVFNIVDTELGKACGNPAGEVLENGRPLKFPSYIALVAKNGAKQMIEATAAPLFDRSGTATGVAIMFQAGSREKPIESIEDMLFPPEERRLSLRADARLPVYLKGADRFFEGETRSLSEKGAYICCQEPLEPKQQCLMVIKPGNPYTFTSSIEVEVVWVNKNGGLNPALPKGMGVRFLKLSAKDRQLLLKLLSDN